MPRQATRAAQPENGAHIGAFLHMMRAERGTSYNTILAYASDLREISQFLKERGRNFLTCARADLESYFAGRAAGGLNPNSAARKLSSLKRFTLFLAAEGKRETDPAQLIEGAKAKR